MAGIDIAALTFDAPGPGSWTLEMNHIPRPVTRYSQESGRDAFWTGFAESAARYGWLIAGVRGEVVNGFTYTQSPPVAADQFEARVAAAERAFDTKLWRQDLARWDGEVKPATVIRHRRLLEIDPVVLDDDALVEYLRKCAHHHQAMTTQHHRFNAAAMVPTGDFLAHAAEWTGMAPARLMALFVGASPISSGGCPELYALVAAIEGDSRAVQAVASDLPPDAVVDELRRVDGPVADAADTWLDLVGYRIIDGFDICEPCAIERPAVLVATLRAALARPAPPDATEAVAAVRAEVPDEHRAEFDDLYAEARLTYRLRDERGIYSDITAAGIVRRAYLSVGTRLASRGTLDSPEEVLDAGIEEVAALLRDGSGPSSAELRDRAAYRRRYSVNDAPAVLGDPPEPRPPLGALPGPLRRMTAAVMTYAGQAFDASDDEHGETLLRGIPASPGCHTGVARVVSGVDDLERLEPGDILVTITTSEAFNVALPLVSAIVTDQGGLLSHAAIMAREYGIPAVVGTREATSRISDGMIIEVDADTGEVRWS